MILTSGEMLVEFVSHNVDCGLNKVSNFSGPYPSGAPAIFIDQAAKVGAKTIMIGSIGNDPFGEALLNRLNTDKVDTSYVQQLDHLTTGTAFVSYYKNGDRIFVYHLENTAADHMPVDLPDFTKLGNPILHISGASLGSKPIRETTLALIEKIKGKGRISYDPNVRPELIKNDEARAAIEKITKLCDIFLPSEADLQFLFPEQTITDCIESLINQGKEMIVVKLGEKGIIAENGTETVTIEGHIVKEKDPTGAGDCFCGIFIGLIDQNVDFTEALKIANAGAALHVTELGPMEWNPSLAEINVFLSSEKQ